MHRHLEQFTKPSQLNTSRASTHMWPPLLNTQATCVTLLVLSLPPGRGILSKGLVTKKRWRNGFGVVTSRIPLLNSPLSLRKLPTASAVSHLSALSFLGFKDNWKPTLVTEHHSMVRHCLTDPGAADLVFSRRFPGNSVVHSFNKCF